MVIICATAAAAGEVIMLLLQQGLLPITHFRVDEMGHNDISVRVTIHSQLSAIQLVRLRTVIQTISETSIQ